MPVNLAILAPCEDGVGGKFRSIVIDNYAWLSPCVQ
jgi:hypothetical protein